MFELEVYGSQPTPPSVEYSYRSAHPVPFDPAVISAFTILPSHTEATFGFGAMVGAEGSASTVIVAKTGRLQPQHSCRSRYLTMYVPAVVNALVVTDPVL